MFQWLMAKTKEKQIPTKQQKYHKKFDTVMMKLPLNWPLKVALRGFCKMVSPLLVPAFVLQMSDLLDGYGRPPVLVLLQDGQTNSARGVDIGVKDGWLKLA